MELYTFQVFLRNLVDVLLVFLAHDDVGDAGTFSSQNLLFDASNGKHLSTQGNLTRHRRILAYLPLCQRRGNRGGDGDAGRRTVFGRCSFRHVDMDVPLVEQPVVNAQRVNMRLHIFQSDDGTFLHHVAQVARKCQLGVLALAQRGFDEKDFSTHTCPRQSCNNTGIVVALIDVTVEGRLAQQTFQFGRCNLLVRQFLIECFLIGQFPECFVDLFLQLAHTALTGILLYHLLDSGLVVRQFLILIKSGVLFLLRNQMAFGNLDFLFRDISADLNQLHTVE